MNAIIRAGYRAFLVSPRNSSAAIAHLLTVTESDFLLTTPDSATTNTVNGTVEALKADGGTVIVRDMPRFEDLLPEGDHDFEALPAMQTPSMDDIAIILHSSGMQFYYPRDATLRLIQISCTGSTNFPKPISLTHRNLIEWGKGTCE
jgi:acyl-CoA synthetase (AMP-forming)/AMP-acid ligase II